MLYRNDLARLITKSITGNTRAQQSQLKQERLNHIIRSQNQVDQMNNEIIKKVKQIQNILKLTELKVFKPVLYYDTLLPRVYFEEYEALEPPTIDQIKNKIGYKKENKIKKLFSKGYRETLIKQEEELQKKIIEEEKNYKKREEEHKELYNQSIKEKEKELQKNQQILKIKKDKYDNNNSEEIGEIVENYVEKIINNIKDPASKYFDKINICLVNDKIEIELLFELPDKINRIKSYKYIKASDTVKTSEFTNSEIEVIYREMVLNTMLSVGARILYYFQGKIETIIINAMVEANNPVTGIKENTYIASTKLLNEEIPYDNIENIDSYEYLQSKNLKINIPLTRIKSIKPYELEKNNKIEISEMSGLEFENISKPLLEKNGFEEVEVTKASGDYGADVIAYKDGIKYAIQCKNYSSKVGVKAVQEVLAAKSMYKCHVGVVLTNNYFTASAEKLAETNGILLWDGDKLNKMLENFKK